MFNPHIFYFILIVYISQLHAYLHHDHFPANFLFGSASSSHQIEGAWLTDGKTPNIWDNMTHSHPELIYDRSNANVACDSYHHVAQDVRLLHEAGVDYYRFSISWARIMPYRNSSIEKRPNKAGLSYYDRLIDELLSHGIAPMVTMYHWDLPQWLQDLGGWLNTEEVLWHFERYADVLFERYGSRVPTWITFNEPKLFCSYGYDKGTWAPLVRLPGIGEYQCAKSVLLANAAVYELYARKYRLQYGGKGRVGITLNAAFWWPKDARNSAHVAAAERAMQFYMGLYMHPIFQGGFPPIVQRTVAKRSRREGRRKSRLPRLTLKERDWIRGKADFVGVNYYTSFLATPVSGARSLDDNEVLDGVDNQWPQAKSQWLRSVPDGLRQTLNWIRRRYDNPVMIITENGWSDDGQLQDWGRIEYYRTHLKAVLDAIKDGCNVQGHTTWSIMDNFEWNRGYTERFGITHVDFDSADRKRTPKASMAFLRNIYLSRKVPQLLLSLS